MMFLLADAGEQADADEVDAADGLITRRET